MESPPEPSSRPTISQPDAVFSRGRNPDLSRSPYERIPSADDTRHRRTSHSTSPERALHANPSSMVGLGLGSYGDAFSNVFDNGSDRRSRNQSSSSSNALHGQGRDSPDDLIHTSRNTPSEAYLLSSYPTHLESSHTLVHNTPTSNPPGEGGRGHSGNIKCSSRKNVVQRRTSWLSISILILAFYSTAFSGIYLVVACVKPRYGRRVGTDGGLSPSTASLLSALFAKTIELSFVTVFVAFLGQVLSRRALAKRSPGISIADMSMRSWIMQPGTLLTHWENVRYSAMTILGMAALTTAWMAMLYTTAAETLVSPKLKFGPTEDTTLYGQVASKFANKDYLANKCLTPITPEMDPLEYGGTCMQLTHVGHSYHNYQQYLADWATISRSGNFSSRALSERPYPTGTWYDNTTVSGEWIDVQNMTELSRKHGRMVNIATAAMPHAGVFVASRDPRNKLRQPSDFAGFGEFYISASVASPAIQVTCVGMTEDELTPIVYSKWPYAQKLNFSAWPASAPSDIPTSPDMLNETVVDDIFGFGKKGDQQAPIFPRLPAHYNTIVNGSGRYPLHSVYLLGASPPSETSSPYVLCSIKGGTTSKCSTQYHAAASGGKMGVNCGDKDDELAYHRTAHKSKPFLIDPDWKNVASNWVNSVSLGTGITDGHSSNARLLMQLTGGFKNETKEYSLNPRLPSLAEALAAMGSSTLLESTEGATFSQYWEYGESPVIEDGKTVYEDFPATIRVSEYASGGTYSWQKIFYVVLVHVFLTNLVCLAYMYFDIRGTQVTDFTEPQNIFALALNSPSSVRLQGACGAGPEGRQLSERWRIEMDEDDEHYYITGKEGRERSRNQAPGHDAAGDVEGSPQKSSLSPAVAEYRKLQKSRHSFTLLS
ncbi:uncharacterized protein CIMG_01213 [Coccidioides immitis RS]|uniref:Mcm2 3 5 family protein n=3 Tax=Coccidioides immitis TaxID=5501 RepID=J3KIP7_COCIM|nr:uncharacterized protein CIMG_01213 [Coccidioides immitis RS]EAS35859.3 hypothetical protein CIMG_01213 [Coccidioides immitis RS]KMP01149.1 hypothetical protein CIRG_01289 [Coccidioides immitis RMSCC 2394]TPX25942.1 hypothetical protein DIZ76_011400 [Coccidioides immitis]